MGGVRWEGPYTIYYRAFFPILALRLPLGRKEGVVISSYSLWRREGGSSMLVCQFSSLYETYPAVKTVVNVTCSTVLAPNIPFRLYRNCRNLLKTWLHNVFFFLVREEAVELRF